MFTVSNLAALFTAVTFILLAIVTFGWLAVGSVVIGIFELITGILWAVVFAQSTPKPRV